MRSAKRTARIAGLLYVLGAFTAPFSLLYLPQALIVPGDVTATANKIRASALLLRIGILCDLSTAIIFIFVALTLYRLLKDVDNQQAVLMVILWLVTVPITFINALNRLAALILVSGANFLSLFAPGQPDAMAILFLRLYSQGNNVNQIFWGLWLVPFGILVFKSGFIPRILGVLLVIAAFGYVAGSVTTLLSPHYGRIVSGWLLLLPALGEVPMVFWLLVKGVKDQPTGEPA
jgi:hypothetical protein